VREGAGCGVAGGQAQGRRARRGWGVRGCRGGGLCRLDGVAVSFLCCEVCRGPLGLPVGLWRR
jgi:hypothetical protein